MLSEVRNTIYVFTDLIYGVFQDLKFKFKLE